MHFETVKDLKSELKPVKGIKNLTDSDLEKIANYVNKNGDSLSTGMLAAFLIFAQDIGFPVTKKMIQGLHVRDYNFNQVISALMKAKILDRYVVAGGMMKDFVRRTWEEDKFIKKSPSREISIYDYNPDFAGELSGIMNKLNLKSEEKIMDTNQLISEAKNTILDLSLLIENDEYVISEDAEEQEMEFFKHMDDSDVEKFAEGLLITLGELESSGKIKKFQKPMDAKNALLAAVRKLYQSRGLLGKEARKYQRIGAERVLRGAKRDISKAQSKKGD